MPWSLSGAEMVQHTKDLQTKTNEVIAASKAVLEPMLEAQGKSLTDGDTFSAVIADINKLKTIERHINNGDLDKMTFVEPGLFSKTVLPSNVIMYNKTRSVFVEEGLLYVIDFDVDNLLIINQRIYKIDPLWEIADGTNLRLIKGDIGIWAIPTQGKTIIGLYGDGLSGEGPIYYKKMDLYEDLEITDFKECNGNVAFISSENIYYRLNNVTVIDYGYESWLHTEMDFRATIICDGNLDYVASYYGEIWHLTEDHSTFEYVIDTKNCRDYEDHMMDRIENPSDYKPILSLVYNNGRWSMIEKSNRLFTCESWSGIDFEDDFIEMTIPTPMMEATIVPNRAGSNDRSIIYGFDNSYNAVAYTFRNEYSEVESIQLGDDEMPQFVSFGVCAEGAVMIAVYESCLKASDYYTEDEIASNNYIDYYYTSMTMRISPYIDYRYDFGPEFNPLFIPNQIASECNTTIITSKSPVSPLFNLAITNDHKHWDFVNIDKDIAINVQEIASGDNTFVMAGLYSKYILVSNYGYDWERIQISENDVCIISITYNSHRNKFYALEYDGKKVFSFDPVTKEVEELDIPNADTLPSTTKGSKIMSYTHNIIINYKPENSYEESYITMSGNNDEDIFINEIEKTPSIVEFVGGVERFEAMFYSDSTDISSCIKYVFETGDDIGIIVGSSLKYYEEEMTDITEYQKRMTGAIAVLIPKYSSNIFDLENALQFGRLYPFEMDHTQPISALMYLNHVVILHPLDNAYIGTTEQPVAPVCYGVPKYDEYTFMTANARYGISEGGYLHLIQAHINKFMRISYIMSSDQAYMPMVTNSDLFESKKALIATDYSLLHDPHTNVKNGNRDVYTILNSKLCDESQGPLIYGDRFVKLSNSDIGHYSYDGIDWTAFSMPKSGNWIDIDYLNGMYVAINYGTNKYSEVWYSTNLVTWNKATLPVADFGWSRVRNISDTLFAICAEKTNPFDGILISKNGINWERCQASDGVANITNISETYRDITDNDARITYTLLIDEINHITYVLYVDSIGSAFSATIELEEEVTYEDIDYTDLIPIHAIIEYNGIEMPVLFTVLYLSPTDIMTYSIANMSIMTLNKPVYKRLRSESGQIINVIYGTNTNEMYIAFQPDEVISYDSFDYHKIMNMIFLDWKRVILPETIDCASKHFIAYHNGNLYIGLSNPVIINIINTFPDKIEGSFLVGSNQIHRQSLPFTPDHVFLFGANTYSKSSKFLLGEIHKDAEITIDGSPQKTIVFFNNTMNSLTHRSDIASNIYEKGFSFVNNTSNDRQINFIAIKENHYS